MNRTLFPLAPACLSVALVAGCSGVSSNAVAPSLAGAAALNAPASAAKQSAVGQFKKLAVTPAAKLPALLPGDLFASNSSGAGCSDPTYGCGRIYLGSAASYIDFNHDWGHGFSLAGPTGDWHLSSGGDLIAPPKQTLNLKSGTSVVNINYDDPGQASGLKIYDGGTESDPTWIYPGSISTFRGPVEVKICTYDGANCNQTPHNPGFAGPWMLVGGGTTGPTQHQIAFTCSARATCTVNFAVPWSASSSYSCEVTSEGAGDAPYIARKTTKQIVITGSKSVARDIICAGY